MASIPGEIADTLFTVYESAPVQAELLSAVTAGEVTLTSVADNFLANVKGTGIQGVLIAAAKGTVESEFNTEIAKLTPATIVAFITKQAQQEVKALGG